MALKARLLVETRKTGDALNSSLRYGMMLNRRDVILNSIEWVAHNPRIKQVRIINHRGQITMSTRSEDLNRRVDRGSAGCTLCHVEPNPTVKPAIYAPGASTLVEDSTMRAFTPVLAEPAASLTPVIRRRPGPRYSVSSISASPWRTCRRT